MPKFLTQDIILLLFNTFISKSEKAKYLNKVSSIIYIIIEIHIDIIFATFIISKFIKNFCLEYFYIINQILYYLIKIQDKSIIFRRKKELKLV